MILAYILITYRKQCKESGKENLAVPLSERLAIYFLLVVLPAVINLLGG